MLSSLSLSSSRPPPSPARSTDAAAAAVVVAVVDNSARNIEHTLLTMDYTRAGPSSSSMQIMHTHQVHQPHVYQQQPYPYQQQPPPQHQQQLQDAPVTVPMNTQPPPATIFRDGSAPIFRASASSMQRPTLSNVRIRSTRDALSIFYAVALKQRPMTVRRLDAEERRAIESGNVYVWEERGASTEATGLGIERWTDGMRWSPSRVRDEFLFYHQKEMEADEAADLLPTRWSRAVRPRAAVSDGSASDGAPEGVPANQVTKQEHDPQRLIKQTYSVIVNLPEDRPRGILRKWHLTAYFTQATVNELSTVDKELAETAHLAVPEGWFRSARTGKARRDPQRGARQITFAPGYGPDAPPMAGPSQSSSMSSMQSAQFHSSPGYPSQCEYSPPGPQYTGYGYDNEDAMMVDSTPRAQGGPYGGSYNAPAPAHPPPPPHSVPSQGPGLGFTFPPPSPSQEFPKEHSAQDNTTTITPIAYEPAPARILPSMSHVPSFRPYTVPSRPRHASAASPSTPTFYAPSGAPHPHPPPIHVNVPASYAVPSAGTSSSGGSASASSMTSGTSAISATIDAPYPEWHTRPATPSSPTALRAAMVPAPPSEAGTPLVASASLAGEKERVLVPLDDLHAGCVYPRRDPMDDAFLRRFNSLRTTPPMGASEQ